MENILVVTFDQTIKEAENDHPLRLAAYTDHFYCLATGKMIKKVFNQRCKR